MSLRERAMEVPVRGQGLPCPIARAIVALDDDDRVVLDEWMNQPVGMKGRRSDRQIAEDLSAELGETFGDYQVGPHRRPRHADSRRMRGVSRPAGQTGRTP